MLSQTLLDQHLHRPFEYAQRLPSSNDRAQAWLRQGAQSGSVVIADEQTQGRGRRGRIWHTPPQVALALSYILKPSPYLATRASMVGALAVYDLCQHLALTPIAIKWPNDVQINCKKVSGILPEAVWQGDQLLGIVLGVGVNVRNQFDEQLAPIATTLEAQANRPLQRLDLLLYLLQRLDHWSRHIHTDDVPLTWKARLNTLGQSVVIKGDNLEIIGQAVDTTLDGALLIKTPDGSIQTVLAGDVSLRLQ